MFGSLSILLAVAGLAMLSAGGLAYVLLYGRIQAENKAGLRFEQITSRSPAPIDLSRGRNLDAAKRTIARFDQRFAQLGRFPFIGRPRPSLAPGLRSLIAGAHLIFYTVEPEQITVVRVIDSRMDIDAEFRR